MPKIMPKKNPTKEKSFECPLLLADTEEKRIAGLSNRDDITPYCGMRFVFDDAAVRSFWNKDTKLDLDIYWLNKGSEIGKDCLPAESVRGLVSITSPGPVDEVVEIVVESCV